MEWHLLKNRISPSYYEWVYGEPINLSRGFENHTTHSIHNDETNSIECNIVEENEMLNLIKDLQGPIENEDADEEDI